MKKLTAIILAVVLCFALGTVAMADIVIGSAWSPEKEDPDSYQKFSDYVNDSKKITLTSGNYYLDKDIPSVGYIEIGDGVTETVVNLDLNGKEFYIQYAGSAKQLNIKKNATLRIWDSGTTGVIRAGTDEGIYNHGTLEIYGGLIKNNSVNGISYVIMNKGVINMFGGRVENESYNVKISGIGSEGGTFNLIGGSVRGATYGVYNKQNSAFYISKGVGIAGNEAYADIFVDNSIVYAHDADGNNGYDGEKLTIKVNNPTGGMIVVVGVTDENADKFELVQTEGYILEREGENLVLVKLRGGSEGTSPETGAPVVAPIAFAIIAAGAILLSKKK